jgi:sporulation protein YlmC with PRC-barrel domain
MKFKKISVIGIGILASLLISGLYADINQSNNNSKELPVVGKSVVDVAVTEVFATGYRASKLIHANVYNKTGEKIGTINDFIIGSEQSITFAILGVGGFLGIGEKLVAVPSLLLEKNDKDQLILPNGEKDNLKSLPEFKYTK